MNSDKTGILKKGVFVLFWLLIWEAAYFLIDSPILLSAPHKIIITLAGLLKTASFYIVVFSSFIRISCGFLLGLVLGTVLAVFAYMNPLFKSFIEPPLKLIKTVPVASFVILALLWISSKNLAVLISFLMVLPVIYANLYTGLASTDKQLLEMCAVFKVSKLRVLRYVYFPSVIPALVSAISVALGFCWKSGIAAEVIGLPKNAIGTNLYEAKLYLMTDELFAWTVVIVAVSVLFEKLVMTGIKKFAAKI